ncbi:DNA methyltransferase [Barnesiella intestinihominis]|uniref:DNA methyltransferase n=1 Tax=Barnesiella intestinihominis TaxID=487174 RepID=UPI0039678B61
MNNRNLFTELEKLLRMDSTYCTEDGTLLKNTIVEAALALRPDLIAKLLTHDGLKRNFFTEISGVMVFDKVKFQKFVMNKRFLPDSYTSFKNKVGLTNEDGEFLSESREIVLSWPYKDCILEGGQTKEDAKRNEVFWNEILAPDEINRLIEPKVLTNFKRFDSTGEHNVESISMDDNLIIKGNNLLALHSLKKKYAGKVKLIYIDPPYNTGSDSFGYNDKFNRSTWLTFMQNRLSIAKKLLKDDGVVCVQCSFHQFAYLRVLMDDLFEKHLCDFNIQVRHPDRALTGDKEFNDIIEYVLIYSNNSDKRMPYKEELKTIDDYTLQIEIKDNVNPQVIVCGDKKVEVYTPEQYKIRTIVPSQFGLKKMSIRGSIREKNSSGRFFVKYIEPLTEFPSETLFKVPNMGDDIFDYRYFYSAPDGKKNGGYFQGMPTSSNVTKKQYANFYNFEKEYNNVSGEGNVSFRNGKKPEALIAFLIDVFTNPKDIVLDYHLGCGTTSAVAHKLQRRYIGMEQMDSQISLIKTRLQNVISGDSTGISQSVDWQGGGSFIYCELAKANQQFADEVEQVLTTDELVVIWKKMQETGFLSWKVNPQEIDISTEDFTQMSLEDQKRFLIECLDKNLLYVPYSEIDNAEFGISESDKIINNQFYQTR